MRQNGSGSVSGGISVCVPVPATDPSLYGKGATDQLLTFLSRNRFEEFSQRELARRVDYSERAVRDAVTVLAENDLVVAESEGNRKLVSINHDRLSVPDDPFMRVPQAEFREPVRTATEELREHLEGVLGIVLYGSVARGEADRRSDVDLWIVVDGDRPANQREANRIASRLEEQRFDGERYAFHVAVESADGVPAYTDEIGDILSSGIPTYSTEEFETLRALLLREVDDE